MNTPRYTTTSAGMNTKDTDEYLDVLSVSFVFIPANFYAKRLVFFVSADETASVLAEISPP